MEKFKHKLHQKGFTLIEILVVIGIIAILAAVVIIAINPARQFAQARNSQRWSNVNAILNAVGQRMADNRGVWSSAGGCPSPIPTVATEIGTGGTQFNLATCVVPTYIPQMLWDPSTGSSTSTGYRILRDAASGRITVDAPGADLSETISVQR